VVKQLDTDGREPPITTPLTVSVTESDELPAIYPYAYSQVVGGRIAIAHRPEVDRRIIALDAYSLFPADFQAAIWGALGLGPPPVGVEQVVQAARDACRAARGE
jgi:hypothetical protein